MSTRKCCQASKNKLKRKIKLRNVGEYKVLSHIKRNEKEIKIKIQKNKIKAKFFDNRIKYLSCLYY